MKNNFFDSQVCPAEVATATPKMQPAAGNPQEPFVAGYDDAADDPFNTPMADEVEGRNSMISSGYSDVTPHYSQPSVEYEITDDEAERLASPQCDYEAYISSSQPSAVGSNGASQPSPQQPKREVAEAEEPFDLQAELDRQFVEKMRQEIEPCLIRADDKIPPLIPVLKRHGMLLCSEGNISAVVGEPKSKKTFLCTAMIGSMMDVCKKQLFGIEHNACRVLWVDTEQSPAHIQKVIFRVNVLGNLPYDCHNRRLQVLQLREKSPKDRLTALSYGIALHRPKLVVVDGVSDLMNNTNNLEESEALVAELLNLSSVGDCHIMCVLHANPNSDKARGHLGSTLMRKAETVMFVHKTGEMSIVEPQHCRNEEFTRFAFRVEEVEDAEFRGEPCVGLGIPVECDLPTERERAEDDCVRILRDCFGGSAERKLLCKKLEDVLGVTPSYARTKVCRAIERGLIIDHDKTITIAEG